MEMKFISSATLYEATKEVIKEIDYKNLNEKNLVVVPDSFSMQAESLIFDVLNIKATFNISVVGISRLAGKLLREHNIDYARISGLDEILYTYEAIKRCETSFLYFKNYSIELAISVLELIKEFLNCELKVEDIKDCEDAVLSKKMHDLRLIYEEYLKLTEDKLDLSKLLDFFLEKSDFFDLSKYNLYFVNFDSFSRQIFSFICALSKKVKSVTIGIAKPLGYGNSYIYETDTTTKMLALARERGLMVKVQERTPNLSEDKLAVLKNVFSVQTEACSSPYFVNIIASDENDELEFVAKYITYMLHNEARFKDFAIAVPEENYFKNITKLFSKYDIPVYADYTLTLGDVAVSKFFLKLLSLTAGINKDGLNYLLSSPFINVKDSEALLKMVDYYEIDSIKAFSARSNALDEIFDMINSFKPNATLEEYTFMSIKFITLMKDNIENIDIYDLQKRSENEQAIVYIEKILDDLKLRKLNLSLEDFRTLISTIFQSIKVETVPSFIDAVYVGDATKSYFADTPYLFILGSTASHLPRTEKDNGLITDEDLSKLNYLKKIEPEIRVINRRNRLKLFEVLQHAERNLFISTPLGGDGRKASFVNDLVKVFGEHCEVTTSSLLNFNRPDLDEKGKLKLLNFHLANMGVAEENFKKIMNALDNKTASSVHAVVDKAMFNFDYENLNSNPLGDKISASELESYFACPFKHFLSYTLKIKEKEYAKEDKRKIGSFKHELNKLFVEENNYKIKMLQEKDVEEFLRRKFKSLCEKYFDETTLVNLAFVHNLFRECKALLLNLVYEQKQSDFIVFGVEKKVISTIADKKFVGIIDRIDSYKNYLRIIDYKTGEVDGVLKDLYYGKKLQLLLYGKVACEELKKTCAGLYYFDCKNKFKKIGDKTKLLNGVTLKDNEIVYATDYRLQEEKFRSDLIGAERKAKKDDFEFKYGNFITDFQKYFDYAQRVSEKAIREIEDGYIAPKPLQGECKFCPYKSVCKYDGTMERKKRRSFNGD